MSQMSNLIKAKGLVTFSSELTVPEGSLTETTNINIDERNVITPRRGFGDYGNSLPQSNLRLSQVLEYKDRILRYYDNTLEYDDGTANFTPFSTSIVEIEDGFRIKYQEAKRNLYITSSDGVKKISARSAGQLNPDIIESAGVQKAFDLSAKTEPSDVGFMPTTSKVAYRVVFGKRDNNNNLLIGSPSDRFVLTNKSTTTAANSELTITIPPTLTTSNFFQVFRTTTVQPTGSLTLNDIDPGEEFNLVLEQPITQVDITTGTVTISDITTEDFRSGGLPLYTNPVTGEGILQSNDPPPVAKDITLFRNTMFYGNTSTRHQLQVNLLSVVDFTSNFSEFIIGNSLGVRRYTFIGEPGITTITCDSFTDTTETTSSNDSYIVFYSANDENKYTIWFNKGSGEQPSVTETEFIEVDLVGTNTASEVASAVRSTLAGYEDFDASGSGTQVIITTSENGSVTTSNSGTGIPATDIGPLWSIVQTSIGSGEDANNQEVLLSGLASIGQAIDATARSLVRVINRDSNGIVFANYISGQDDLPGKISLESRILTDDPFYISTNDSNISNKFNPELPVIETISTITTVDSETVNVNAPGHGLFEEDVIYINSPNTTPVFQGSYIIDVIDVDNFTVKQNITSDDLIGTNAFFFLTNSNIESDNLIKPNRIYFSKTQLPEAVPSVNFIDVGPEDQPIERILSLRDNLFVLKTDGVYIVDGVSAPNFSVRLLDNSASIIAPDSAVVLNNLIYCLSTQGVVTISETGVSVISRVIENKILGITNSKFNFRLPSFGISYESDRAYLLFLPSVTTDTTATQCYRYNIFETSWTRWEKAATCGVVAKSNDKIYIGDATRSFLQQERKNFDRTDFSDRDFPVSIVGDNKVNDKFVELNLLDNIVSGDVLFQKQYVTIATYNRILRKLDIDNGLTDDDYTSSLRMNPGDNLRSKLQELNDKLVSDDSSNTVTPKTFDNDLVQQQILYNNLIDELNLPSCDTIFKNYMKSEGFTEYEGLILNTFPTQNIVELNFLIPFIQGDLTLFKGYLKSFQYAPLHFGNPSALKQIREGTIIFDQNNFYGATLSYSSDVSANFVDIPFFAKGIGYWGYGEWGSQNPEVYWGGEGNDIPFRTHIPKEKQRCRYLNVKFSHLNSREEFRILGISAVVRPLSSRAYR